MFIRLAAILIALSVLAPVHAEQTAPNADILKSMGLGELRILTDHEALAIRGHGFDPAEFLEGFESYQTSKAEFAEHVAEFRERIASHTFARAATFKNSQEGFQKQVTKFRAKVSAFQNRIH